MTFNIGNQTGGIINNVGGDQIIHGDQRGEVVTLEQARAAARDLRGALERTGLGADPAASRQVQDIDAELHSARPEKATVAARLDGLARRIAAVGGWIRAGAAIIGPMRILATWLGHLGVPILGLLPALG